MNQSKWFDSIMFIIYYLLWGGPQIITDIPGYIPKPNERYEVLIRIVGLNEMGEVIAKPGDDISLKCLALSKLKVSLIIYTFFRNRFRL